MVQASLRTKEVTEARTRHAVADGALKRLWDAERNGPMTLNKRQITALCGLLYKDFIDGLSDEPGTAEIWEEVENIHASYRARGKTEKWIGPSVDAVLTREGLVVDETSWKRLAEAAFDTLDRAAGTLKRNARGDYSPDPVASTFPTWTRPSISNGDNDAPRADSILSVDDLFERWAAYNADKKAANTIKRYRGSFRSLIRFAEDRDVRSLTGDDIYAWALHREKVEGITAKAVNKNDLVAVSSVFSWAMSRQGGTLLTANPVSGSRLDEPKEKGKKREKHFREKEIGAILSAASSVKPNDTNPTLYFAYRWCPWLAAYSGARIAELTHLEKRDIRVEDGVTLMDLRVTKTDAPRLIPIHEHLIEQGFLAFVEASGPGPLFFDPERHDKKTATPPAEQRGQKVAKWVREVAKLDPNVDPNHGWRHTWKTKALDVGIEERIRDAITGHRVRSVGRSYEAPTLKMKAKAMKRFPRYKLDLTA
ncbi:Tyrosine recombinase XerC [Methylobacterium iners]|uniref:Tyrosine recombinase XerC n=2 Tax=Methylobacterium iners TaxID=418707 RepID=A0ABQ4RQR1_9HYPH|nr:Tyrosine recombinase XerC [Methylobacterium iners]